MHQTDVKIELMRMAKETAHKVFQQREVAPVNAREEMAGEFAYWLHVLGEWYSKMHMDGRADLDVMLEAAGFPDALDQS